ncbi:MAG: site-specific integrase [Gallionellaceae bacterium]|nr:site-specific integrase [Gallionellaceae bacterium]
MASIIKRGPYQFQATVRRKGYATQTRTFETKRAAEAWAMDTEAKMLSSRFVDGRLARSTTLEACLARYLEEATPNKKGAEAEGYKIADLRKRPIAQLVMNDVRSHHVAEYIKQRRTEVSDGTVTRELCILSMVFQCARRNWGFEELHNPVRDVDRPSPGKPRKRRISEGELEALCAASESPVLAIALRLAVETAMRRGELAALTWSNVDLDGQTAYLPDTKNGDDRTVPLSRKAVEMLRAMPRINGDDRVLGIRADAITRAMSRARERAGLSDVRFHDTRREGTTRLVKKLGNSLEVSAVTGHRCETAWKTFQISGVNSIQ